MAQEIGKVIKVEPVVEGTNEKGDWLIQVFVIMTQGDHPNPVAFRTFSKERAAVIQSLRIGETVLVEYKPESREFNGKWFTDLRCSRIMVAEQKTASQKAENEGVTKC